MTRAEKSEQTQARITEVARGVFAERGYAQASLAEIVREADVTTGAIYHHYGDKKGLFLAVAEHLEREILDAVTSVEQTDNPWSDFVTGVVSTLEICARPDIQRIVFREAPTVIGFAEWREIEVQYAFGLMQSVIVRLAGQGYIFAPNPELTAHVILGAIIQAAHAVASSTNSVKALTEARETILLMVEAIQLEQIVGEARE